MITLPTGTRIWIIAGITDMRCGFNGLASKVQNTLKDAPFSGHIFVFRGRSGKMVKILWADRDGLCLFAKRLGVEFYSNRVFLPEGLPIVCYNRASFLRWIAFLYGFRN